MTGVVQYSQTPTLPRRSKASKTSTPFLTFQEVSLLPSCFSLIDRQLTATKMGRPAQHARLAALLLLLVAACASPSSQPALASVMDTLRAGLKQAGGPAHVSPAFMQADEYGYDSGYHTE